MNRWNFQSRVLDARSMVLIGRVILCRCANFRRVLKKPFSSILSRRDLVYPRSSTHQTLFGYQIATSFSRHIRISHPAPVRAFTFYRGSIFENKRKIFTYLFRFFRNDHIVRRSFVLIIKQIFMLVHGMIGIQSGHMIRMATRSGIRSDTHLCQQINSHLDQFADIVVDE